MEDLPANAELAPISRRLWAFLLDLVAVLVGSLVLELVLGGLSGLTNPIFSVEKFSLSPVIYVVNVLAIAAYFTLLVAKNGGQTLGASAMKVKVVDISGSSLTVGRSFMRFVMLIVSLAIAGIGFLVALIDARRRTLADHVTGTVVVRAPRGPDW